MASPINIPKVQTMLSSQNASKTIIPLLLYCFIPGLCDHGLSDMPYQFCPENSSHPHDRKFQNNLNNLLTTLASNASLSNFHRASSGNNDSGRLYGLYMCLGYNKNDSCKNCVVTASQNIIKFCHNASEAVAWEDDCQLRYSNKEFFGAFDIDGNTDKHNPTNDSEPEQFNSAVKSILGGLTKQAALDSSPNKYAFGQRQFLDEKINAVVQCTGDLSPNDCKACLEIAIANVSTCCYSYRGARILSKSCYLRYELYDFRVGDSVNQGPVVNWVPKKSK